MDHDNPIVFVVDDDRSIWDSLRNLLGSAGLRVETFASAQEFLTSRRPQAPSCLVLDVQLPGWSGLDLQQELAKVEAHNESPRRRRWDAMPHLAPVLKHYPHNGLTSSVNAASISALGNSGRSDGASTTP